MRIYADGVYDLFHFGHALQLRQAKLAFPVREGDTKDRVSGVHLLVGVNSDEQCVEHKNIPIMRHAERCALQSFVLGDELSDNMISTYRCEAVRHCRWVDEVIPDAPWVIDQEFIEKVRRLGRCSNMLPHRALLANISYLEDLSCFYLHAYEPCC